MKWAKKERYFPPSFISDSEKKDMGYQRWTDFLALITVVAFAISRIADALNSGHTREAAISAVANGAAILVILILRRLRNFIDIAFVLPLFLFTLYTTASYCMGRFDYLFYALIGITCLAGMYLKSSSLLGYILVSNAVMAILVYFRIPQMNPDRIVTLSDIMVRWIIEFFVSLLIYLLTRIASEKSRRSNRDRITFITLLATTPNYIVIMDRQFRVTYLSKTMVEFTGIEDSRLIIGRPIIDLFQSIELKIMLAKTLEFHGYYKGSWEVQFNGGKRYFDVIFDTFMGEDGYFINMHDSTPLAAARFEAEKAAEAKSIFLANTSHEIRTPMNAILGMAELILRRDISQEVYVDALSIKNAGTNLLAIVNDILDFSKIESGKLDIVPAPYSLSSLLNDTLNIIRLRLINTEKPIQFLANIDSKLPDKFLGDELRIRQILLNLLSNAVKYTNEGQITLSLTGEGKERNICLVFRISDTGTGIKPEDMSKLFQEFNQLNTHRSPGIEGTGLGLAISLNLCRLMGGDITVESLFGAGTVFTARIPQKALNPVPIAGVEVPEARKVLLYDHRPPYRWSVSLSLRNLGVQVTKARELKGLFTELESGSYSHAFISPDAAEEAADLLKRLGLKTILVILADLEELPPFYHFPILTMPAYTVPIANVLNGLLTSTDHKKTIVSYIAPEAKILVVDDILTNLNVAKGLMSIYQTEIHTASSGKEAIELIKKNSYDIVFMDHMMPEMDGIEAAEIIRAMEGGRFQSVPLIALTANAVTGMREMFLEHGFDDYLAKPIEISKLDKLMDKWLPQSKRAFNRGEETLQELPVETKGIEIEGVDTAEGIILTGGTEEGYRSILQIFCLDAAAQMNCLTSPPSAEQMPLFINAVHGIKGIAASIGANTLSAEARVLEMAGKTLDIETIIRNLDSFTENLMIMIERIQAFLADSGA
ncbi:ATP-binding protein [Treponema primitia]|uniref:hybrid sensor histidine kinase/response regulator n=1 Tax=Treponema primitia TaxID=88058 RepID=UPI00397EDB7F